MVITLTEIKSILKDLLEGKLSREDAAIRGFDLRESFDNGMLEFIPPENEAMIWDAIQFLEGIDLKDEPISYLHNKKDIEMFYDSIVKDGFA